MNSKKKMVIVTANDFLAYQPSILNLYDFLEPAFDVSIVSFDPQYISKQKPSGRKTVYLKVPALLKWTVLKFDFTIQLFYKLLAKFSIRRTHTFFYYYKVQYFYLEKYLRSIHPDELVAVDIPALYLTQRVFGKCHFFSLEIYPGDPYREKIKEADIYSVIIQNKERYDYLFPGVELPVFYVQNAPIFSQDMMRAYDRKDMIWAGTITRHFAVLECIEFIKHYSSGRLVLKGGAERKTLQYINTHYQSLFDTDRLFIERSYLAAGDFIDYLAHFRIGFCFYSWDLIRGSINYQTAPSGKLFMYMAAGVPVIACNIPGFRFVEEFGAGVLIDDYKPDTIRKAVELIGADHEKYSRACYRVAENYSFDKTIRPFIDFLTENGTV